MPINKIDFEPFPGLGSGHLQTILASLLLPGKEPPSKEWLVDLGEDSYLSCWISTPQKWQSSDQTVLLLHGMGGSTSSDYMIRISRKLYLKGYRVVRINLRGCGSGRGRSKRLYHAGVSDDLLQVLHLLKERTPYSEMSLIGFSLGGNIALKLSGELGKDAKSLVKRWIAISPPLNLAHTVNQIQKRSNRLYHSYYLKRIRKQAGCKKIASLYDFDDQITAPPWGYAGADQYYQECSSIRFLPLIEQTTHLLFAEDDPFISFEELYTIRLPEAVTVSTTKKGGHMGFLGKPSKKRTIYWLDEWILNLIE